MPISKTFNKLVHYEQNTRGRDFVVGDLHGCIEPLAAMMQVLQFDATVDRMFSVGDLVDRGPNSLACAQLIYEPWFYAVQGNHEMMMWEAVINKSREANQIWLSNGGMWHISENPTELKDAAADIKNLPLVITVGEGDQRFNVVHAELIHTRNEDRHSVRVPVTDEMIDNWVFTEEEENSMIWGRTMISNGHPTFPPPQHQLWHDLEKMSLTFVGHTPVRDPVICQRQMYIDGGAVFHYKDTNKSEQNTLIIACPTEKVLYKYTLLYNQINAIPFHKVQQLS